ncbi:MULTISPECIES: Rho termination factor N-terminal domain-containing protein [Enterococcus]|uniref:Rho termination factor N-terminal domain-containing protein n=1 Tax=Enterococcus TaxID=1350 RepID=UPI0028D0C81D|nr:MULTISPECIES: Rho termination factor N-terminal domain-containing protein [Enterococcus]
MIVEIRKSISGTEYWDTETKKTIFVPKGKRPDFEIAENPESMITPEDDKVIVPNLSAGQIINGTIKAEILNSDVNTEEDLDGEPVEEMQQESLKEELSELDSMTIKQLREYAKENNITIPSALKTKGDIIALISDYE